jgi:two-component system response regulator AtoC
VKVSCPAIPNTLFESELFGYEKGAFTGANGKKAGRITLAAGGTLFLDEIGELDSALQAKLLQFLQDGRFCPIGGAYEEKVDIRVICATHRNLELEIANGTFREDLYYRINVLKLHLPPLRERTDDVADLVQYFIELFNEKFNCQATRVSPSLLSALEAYAWPGNIRQLENMMKRYVILGSEEAIAAELTEKSEKNQWLAPLPEFSPGDSISLKKVTRDMVRNFERRIITKMLQAHHWNRVHAARALNISYRALLYKVKDSQLIGPDESSKKSKVFKAAAQ